MERLLEAFDNINLSIIHLTGQRVCQATPLTAVAAHFISVRLVGYVVYQLDCGLNRLTRGGLGLLTVFDW
ncbi:MAG: hypothetical protein IPM39_19325 [Chloroflexi bacterium]|nr:hypothetical protein [Chloroflexota bacterium]